MAALTPTTIRGLIVPDPRITSSNLWAAESNYTEAGPVPGTAAAQQATEMALHTSGSQSSGTVEVRALRGGGVETAALVWKGSADSSTSWRGWDVPGVVTGFQTAQYETGTSEAGRRHPHAVTLTNGTVLVATSDSLGGTSKVEVIARTAAGAYSSATVASESTSGTLEMRPALVVLPSGRVLCFYFTYATTSWNVSCEYSDDDGATWTLQRSRCVSGPGASATYVPNFIRAAYVNGQILLLTGYAAAGTAYVAQHASIDQGSSFTLVSTYDTAAYEVLSGDCVGLTGGGFLVALWISDNGASDFFVRSARIGSAFQALDEQFDTSTGTTRVDIMTYATGTTNAYGNVALCRADSGHVYCYMVAANKDAGTTPKGVAVVTEDDGRTWLCLGENQTISLTGTRRWFITEADAAYPYNITATWQRGRVLLYSNVTSRATAVPTNGNSLYEWQIGGYSTVTIPSYNSEIEHTSTMTMGAEWCAIQDPASNGYTLTSAGAPTTAFDTAKEAWEITAAASGADYAQYTDTVSITPADGYMYIARLRVDAGIAHTGIEVDIGGGNNNKAVVTLSTTQMALVDLNDILNLATAVTSSATWYDVMVWYDDGTVRAWYRAVTASGEDREWTLLGALTLTDTAAASTDSVYFGIPSSVAVDTESYWRRFSHADTQGLTMAAGFTNPTDLRPRKTSTLPIYLDDGLSVAARGGPAATSDEWDIVTEHRYSVDHIHPREYPSPSVGWRATTDTDSMTIAWRTTDETTGTNESDLWALYIDGTNIPQLKIQYTTSTTPGWTDWAGANLLMEFAGTRTGSTVQPINTGTANPDRYIERDELVGGSVKLSSGDVRRIIRNDAGYLTSGSTIQNRVRIFLDEDDLDATDGTSGTFELRFPRALIVFNSPFATSQGPVVGLRLIINTATRDGAPENYWKIGTFALGPLTVWGTQYSATRRRTLTPNVDMSESASGRRRTRVRGNPRQAVDVAWTEGVDLTWTAATTQDDYLLPAASKEPMGSKHDAPRLLWGLVREIDGEHTPVVYVPSSVSGTAGTTAYLTGRAGGAIFGRIVGGVDAETLLGDEEEDELVRCAFTLEEEL